VVANQEADHDEPAGAEVQALLDKLGACPTSDLISVLQQVQDSFGYLAKKPSRLPNSW